MYNFKKFEDRNLRTEDRITITRGNSIGFPTKFYNDNQLSGYKYAVLYFDQERKAVGVQFTNNESEKGRFTLMKSAKYGASIVSRSFFKANEIDLSKVYGRYNWKKVAAPIGDARDSSEIYVVELAERE